MVAIMSPMTDYADMPGRAPWLRREARRQRGRC